MMNNHELYKKTFSQIHASPDKIAEVINMSETTKRRKILSKKLIAVAACAACVLSVGVVANAATDGELGKTVIGWFTNADGETSELMGEVSYDENGKKSTTADLEDGGKITMEEYSNGGSLTTEWCGEANDDTNKDITIDVDEDGQMIVHENSEDSEESDTSLDTE